MAVQCDQTRSVKIRLSIFENLSRKYSFDVVAFIERDTSREKRCKHNVMVNVRAETERCRCVYATEKGGYKL